MPPLELALIAAKCLAGLAALYFGASWLVAAASDLARRLGVSPLLIGLTVVAVGTSLPELFVAVSAALGGHDAVSLGNVVGANALNIGLILGVAALIRPIEVRLRVLQWDLPVMLAATALLAWFAFDGVVGRAEGLVLLAGMFAYLGLNVQLGRRERRQGDFAGTTAVPPAGSLQLDLARGAGGALALAIGAQFLVDGALGAAAALDLSEGAVGMTIVAAGTTLPELVTTLVAASRRQGDLAFGNVVGSNINNALTVVGTASAIAPLSSADLGGAPLVGLLALTALSAPVAWRGFVVNRWEGGLLVCGYAAFLWFSMTA
ncbi:MAG: hypothetical protein A3F77_14025 [Betaproteobacteria bacterium RIFCSPLOWO2_12_FULL_67_28]|nr:MAG: hypothetical protein A3F77_14025 [Betaproteobacteria bacterium RIFCSPLOWO2_12_FULL_67_28]